MPPKFKRVIMKTEIAELMAKYCIFNGIKINDYLTSLVQNDLSLFKKQLEKMRELK